jgi:hypothetical protein
MHDDAAEAEPHTKLQQPENSTVATEMSSSIIMSGKPSPPSASTSSSVDSDGHLWDVAEILAERTTVSGDLELLVVWKTSWIPKANMIADGPVLRRFEAERKCSFTAGKNAMRITLPVQPGSSLAADCDDLDHRSHCKRNIARLDAAAATSSAKIKHDDAAEAKPHTKLQEPENGTEATEMSSNP